jgi:hypothetical protein
VEEQEIAPRYPVFKPVSLPDFQIGNDSQQILQVFWCFAMPFGFGFNKFYRRLLQGPADRLTVRNWLSTSIRRGPPRSIVVTLLLCPLGFISADLR